MFRSTRSTNRSAEIDEPVDEPRAPRSVVRRAAVSVALAATALFGVVGLAAADASPAHADDLTSSWLTPLNQSRATCTASGSINISEPANDPSGTVRADYLYYWNGSQWAYTGRAASETSNGYYYFAPYAGSWTLSPTAVIFAPSHGYYYSVFEQVSRSGRVVSQGWFTDFNQSSVYAPHVSYCYF